MGMIMPCDVYRCTAQAADLELAREISFLKLAIKVQKVGRGMILKRRCIRLMW
jgi:hypothetical protein